MKCKLCSQYFMEETKLFNLFSFPDICKTCQEDYRPTIQFEMIPIDYGFIEYYYLYDEIKTNTLQREYLFRYFELLINPKQKYQGNIMIILNQNNLDEIKNDIEFLKPFQKITILSLVRINLDVFMSFL